MRALRRSEHEARFLRFSFRQGWFCQFLEEDGRTPLPRTMVLRVERKLFELVKRGGFTLVLSGPLPQDGPTEISARGEK